jgi:hypothetical protein
MVIASMRASVMQMKVAELADRTSMRLMSPIEDTGTEVAQVFAADTMAS